jgi:hypothetical protein
MGYPRGYPHIPAHKFTWNSCSSESVVSAVSVRGKSLRQPHPGRPTGPRHAALLAKRSSRPRVTRGVVRGAYNQHWLLRAFARLRACPCFLFSHGGVCLLNVLLQSALAPRPTRCVGEIRWHPIDGSKASAAES